MNSVPRRQYSQCVLENGNNLDHAFIDLANILISLLLCVVFVCPYACVTFQLQLLEKEASFGVTL
jgi:hypothetical protein